MTVRRGKENLFKEPLYDRIYDGRPVREYLSMFWVGRVAKYQGAGSYEQAYAKWLVLHYLWGYAAPVLRPRAFADQFRSLCERRRWPVHLDEAAKQAYLAALDFYRKRRGKGRGALDVSNFFYRPHLHTQIEAFMRGPGRVRRRRIKDHVRGFAEELREALAST